MKLHNMIVAALVALTGFAYAQQPAKTQGLVAVVQANEKAKPVKRMITRADGKDTYVFFDNSDETEKKGNAAKARLFFLQTPVDLAEAERSLNARDFAAARTQLGAVKTKYASFVGLDRNPSTRAAMLELECAVRQLDFAALKTLVGSFQHADWLSLEDRGKYMAAGILAKACTGAAADAVVADVDKLLAANAGKTLNGSCYGWLQYAIAYSTAAAIPAAEISGTISEANVAAAHSAIDAYCRAGVSSHGSAMELPADAMSRAQALLWAMPGVKEYAAKASPMDANKWNAAPANFRDAVALAYMLKNVFDTSNATVDEAAKYFFNTRAGKE